MLPAEIEPAAKKVHLTYVEKKRLSEGGPGVLRILRQRMKRKLILDVGTTLVFVLMLGYNVLIRGDTSFFGLLPAAVIALFAIMTPLMWKTQRRAIATLEVWLGARDVDKVSDGAVA
jgi:hypothetical protein